MIAAKKKKKKKIMYKPLPLWTFPLNLLLPSQQLHRPSSVHYFQKRQPLLHSVSIKKMKNPEHIF